VTPRRGARHRWRWTTLAVAAAAYGCSWGFRFDTLPGSLADDEFWQFSTEMSEPGGVFQHSDNLVSNESDYANTISLLRSRGGAYIGVGPEQNFSYIARLQPEIAFIVDIRRENRALHLLYKALFEAARDRADFTSRLFSRERPRDVNEASTAQRLFTALDMSAMSAAVLESTKQVVRDRLLERHAFAVSQDDLAWIDYALTQFAAQGPEIRYGSSATDTEDRPSYRTLMTLNDVKGTSRSYLATEEQFRFVKDLQTRNMIVPIVGDFSGPTAIRRVGEFIRERGGLVSAFYSSNVEIYLSKQQSALFCSNLDSLPTHSQTWFIHSRGIRLLPAKVASCMFKPRPGGTSR
jgi:hypothetical protein